MVAHSSLTSNDPGTERIKLKTLHFLPLWTELSQKYLGKEKSVFRGWCKTASMTSQRSYWHDIAIHSGVMTLCCEQLKRHKNRITYWEFGRKIINHYTPEGTRESHPRVHDLGHPRLGKSHHGLQIMDTGMGFPCSFQSVVIDAISLYSCLGHHIKCMNNYNASIIPTRTWFSGSLIRHWASKWEWKLFILVRSVFNK